MERPKSAKYNIERVKKSSTYLNTSAKRQVSNLSNGSDENNNNNRPIPAQRTTIHTNIDTGGDVGDPQQVQQTLFDRQQQSKSAYIPRPQSARHNLDKYRQDVLVERQKKLTIGGGEGNEDASGAVIPNTTAVVAAVVHDPAAIFDLLMDEDDMDKLDALLIREDADSSSSDIESNHSSLSNNTNPGNQSTINNNNNNNINAMNGNGGGPQKMKLKPVASNQINNHNRSKKLNSGLSVSEQLSSVPPSGNSNNRKSKLLAKRNTGSGGENNSHHQLANKSVLLNQYTTFRPTAVTTNYSSSPLGVSSASNNSNGHHQTTVITLHPVNGVIGNNNEMSGGLNDTLIGSEHTGSGHVGSGGLAQNINSSSSSTSTSSSSKKHLLTASADSSSNGSGGKNEASSVKRDQLLKEWLKHDDEVELEIMTINPPGQGAVVIPAGGNGSRQQMNSSKTYNYPPQQPQQNSRLNRANSRFSDYSSNSNPASSGSAFVNHTSSNSNGNNSNMNSFQTKERTNLIDPWTKRNPTLVAQNVLLKHRAELEQLAASRTANNTSQVSNASTTVGNGVMYGNHNHHHQQNASKYLLPDNKYYKK
jgi:hypothetical protein